MFTLRPTLIDIYKFGVKSTNRRELRINNGRVRPSEYPSLINRPDRMIVSDPGPNKMRRPSQVSI